MTVTQIGTISVQTWYKLGTNFSKSIVISSVSKTILNEWAELQKIGIRRSLENGAKFGRKTLITDKLVQKVVDLRHQGLSMRGIATELDVSTTIVQKSLKMSIVAV